MSFSAAACAPQVHHHSVSLARTGAETIITTSCDELHGLSADTGHGHGHHMCDGMLVVGLVVGGIVTLSEYKSPLFVCVRYIRQRTVRLRGVASLCVCVSVSFAWNKRVITLPLNIICL